MTLRFIAASLGLALLAFTVRADLPDPEGPVILTIVMPDGAEVALDRQAITSLPRTDISTTTIWTKGTQRFSGVSFSDLLAAVGYARGAMTLVAANGYRIEGDAQRLRTDAALLAIDRNGQAMTRRDKGPVWLVYDYDSDPDLQTEVIYSNSIWQLDRIELGN